jgi:hypothetical protein
MNTVDDLKKYVCTDTVITAALVWAILALIPTDQLVNAIPIPGLASGTTVGSAVLATIIASFASGYVSKNFCDKMA